MKAPQLSFRSRMRERNLLFLFITAKADSCSVAAATSSECQDGLHARRPTGNTDLGATFEAT